MPKETAFLSLLFLRKYAEGQGIRISVVVQITQKSKIIFVKGYKN